MISRLRRGWGEQGPPLQTHFPGSKCRRNAVGARAPPPTLVGGTCSAPGPLAEFLGPLHGGQGGQGEKAGKEIKEEKVGRNEERDKGELG